MFPAKSEAKPSIAEKVKALLEQAEKGAQDVFTSENYLRYLRAMSVLHHYSARNVLLILMQKPDASMIAGYTTWQKSFHRQVKHGETGLAILGYAPQRRQVDVPVKDALGNLTLNDAGELITERQTKIVPAFRPMYVFDVSQTEGEPIPQLVTDLQTSVERYQEFVDALISLSPYPVAFEEVAGSARGFCDPAGKRIVVKKDLSQSQTIKTLVHEIAHARMHESTGLDLSRGGKEVEAESMAFVVCNHLGIDTGDYSFPYIASWASGKEVKELQASLDRIQKAATVMIDEIDHTMNKAPAQELAYSYPLTPFSSNPIALGNRIAAARAAAASINETAHDKTTEAPERNM